MDFKNQKLIFDICLNPLIMCKEGWCLGLGRESGANCLKALIKRRWNRKESRGNKHFKKGGKLGQAGARGGCLKKNGGAGTPLQTMIQFLQSSEPSLQILKNLMCSETQHHKI